MTIAMEGQCNKCFGDLDASGFCEFCAKSPIVYVCQVCGHQTDGNYVPDYGDQCKVCNGSQWKPVGRLQAAVDRIRKEFGEEDQKRIAWMLEWNEEKEN